MRKHAIKCVDFPFEHLVGASGHLVVTYEVRDGPISSYLLAISWGIKDFDKSNSDCSSTHLSLTTEPKPLLQSENYVVQIYVARLFSAASCLLFLLPLGSRSGAEGVALGFNLATDSVVAWYSRNLALNFKWASDTNIF